MSGEESNSPLGMFGPALGIDPAAVQSRLAGQQSQSGAEHFGDQVSHGGKDPSYITEMEQFEGFSHEEIHTNVDTMTPGIMHALADRYEELANALSGGLFGANLAIQRELSDGMEGQFADSAGRAARQFYDQATDVQEVFRSVGFRIKAAAYGAEVVKKSVPPPPTHAPGASSPTSEVAPAQVAQTVVGALDPASAAALDRYKEDQRLVAVQVMNMAYKPTYQPAGDGVPSFVPVQAPGDSPGTTNPNSTSPGGPGGTTTSTSPGGVTPGGETPGGENPGEEAAPETPGTEEESQTTTAGTEDNPATQQPAGTTTGTPTGDPQRTTPSTTTTGSPSVAPGSPSGSPSRPGGTPQAQTPGKTVTSTPGAQNVPSGGPAAAAAASSAAGANRGMSGMMSPGAAGRRGEDDAEHTIPDYLIHDREEELFGAPITAVNGVLGADAPAAQPADDRNERGDRR